MKPNSFVGSLLLAGLLPLAVAGFGAAFAAAGASLETPVQRSFDAATDEFAAEWLRANPTAAGFTAIFLRGLYDELFRARRFVVHTGLHAQHWTRQQAIDYSIPAGEVERYVVMHGQACAYKPGELELVAERGEARKSPGRHFSLKKFHNLLLQTGTVPLTALAQVVGADIADTLKH